VIVCYVRLHVEGFDIREGCRREDPILPAGNRI
jgi:hypothetical protein